MWWSRSARTPVDHADRLSSTIGLFVSLCVFLSHSKGSLGLFWMCSVSFVEALVSEFNDGISKFGVSETLAGLGMKTLHVILRALLNIPPGKFILAK